MINDNPKPNKVDMRGIQRKGPGGDDAYDGGHDAIMHDEWWMMHDS